MHFRFFLYVFFFLGGGKFYVFFSVTIKGVICKYDQCIIQYTEYIKGGNALNYLYILPRARSTGAF